MHLKIQAVVEFGLHDKLNYELTPGPFRNEKEMDINFIKSQAGKWQAEADAENAKQSARLAGRMKAQTLLLSQIRDNEDARARERQQEYFQMRLMKQQEATFEHQLNAMKGETYVPNDFRKKSAGWFS